MKTWYIQCVRGFFLIEKDPRNLLLSNAYKAKLSEKQIESFFNMQKELKDIVLNQSKQIDSFKEAHLKNKKKKKNLNVKIKKYQKHYSFLRFATLANEIERLEIMARNGRPSKQTLKKLELKKNELKQLKENSLRSYYVRKNNL